MRGVAGAWVLLSNVLLASVISACPAAAEPPRTFWGLVDEIMSTNPSTLDEVGKTVGVPLTLDDSAAPLFSGDESQNWETGPVRLSDGRVVQRAHVFLREPGASVTHFTLDLRGACVSSQEVRTHYPNGKVSSVSAPGAISEGGAIVHFASPVWAVVEDSGGHLNFNFPYDPSFRGAELPGGPKACVSSVYLSWGE